MPDYTPLLIIFALAFLAAVVLVIYDRWVAKACKICRSRKNLRKYYPLRWSRKALFVCRDCLNTRSYLLPE